MSNGGNGGAGCYSRDGNFYISRFAAEEIEAKLQRIDSKPLKSNCPNCGAPITGPACEYCDTIFDIQAVNDQAKQQTLNVNYVCDVERISAIVKSATSRMERFRGI